MTVKSPAAVRAALEARRTAEAAAKKTAAVTSSANRRKPAAELKAAAASSRTSSGVRQTLGIDELSRGRGAALRGPGAGMKLGGPLAVQASSGRSTVQPFAATTRTSLAGDVKLTPDTVSASASGGFSGEVKSANGWGVSFGVNAKASVVANEKTENGITSFTVTADASVTLSGGVNTPKAGLAIAHTEGIKAEYAVTMPEAAARGVDPKTVNPFDPASMPTGTVVTLDGSRYSSNEFKATFKHLSVETKVTNSTGVSVAVEKTGANTVRVTAGPTEAIQAYNGVGVDFGIASAKLGRNDELKSATLKTAEFDLSTPEGKAAYNAFLTSGKLPAEKGPGVRNVATVEKHDYSSEVVGGLSVGPIDLSFHGQKNTGSSVVTTYPDGSKDITVKLDYGSNVPLELTRRFDKDGKEILSQRRYAYTIKADENSAELMNAALTGDVAKATSGPVKPGQTVTLTFTEAQMRAYMQQTQKAADAGFGHSSLDVLVKDYDGKFINSPEDFALALARNLGGADYEQAERLFTVSDGADGKFDGKLHRINATVTVN